MDGETPNTPPPAPAPVPPASGGMWEWYNTMPKPIRHSITAAVATLCAVLVVWVGGLAKVNVQELKQQVKEAAKDEAAEQVKKVEAAASEPIPSTGWYSDHDELAAARAAVTTVFRQTPAGGDEALPADVFQWQKYRQVTGSPPPIKDQKDVGSCVGFGATTAYERALACSIAAGERFEFTRYSEEATYALSRVEIGGGRLRGQDGSVGGWAAKAFTNKGAMPAKVYGSVDLTKYDTNRCRRWGDSGLPDDLEPEAAQFTAGDAANLRSWSEAKRALANGAGVFLCSRIGFNKDRDANGVCSPGPLWGHCTCLDGYHVDVNGKEYGHIQNSWGTYYHRGPLGWGGPPDGGFWAESRVIGQMIAEGDSWAVSAVKGFPKQKLLDWTVDARPVRPDPRDPLGVFAFAR